MSAQTGETASAGVSVAVRFVAADAVERLTAAVRLPSRDIAAEDKLRDLLTALYAAYPEVLQSLKA